MMWFWLKLSSKIGDISNYFYNLHIKALRKKQNKDSKQ
jgi:hypothetical protein